MTTTVLLPALQVRSDAFGELSWWNNHVMDAVRTEMAMSAAHMDAARDLHEAAHQLVWDAAEEEEEAEEAVRATKWHIMEAREAADAVRAALKAMEQKYSGVIEELEKMEQDFKPSEAGARAPIIFDLLNKDGRSFLLLLQVVEARDAGTRSRFGPASGATCSCYSASWPPR